MKKENAIIINGVKHTFMKDSDSWEVDHCFRCSMHEYCAEGNNSHRFTNNVPCTIFGGLITDIDDYHFEILEQE